VKAARRGPLRALNISPELLYKWQKEALTPVAAACGTELDPAKAAELRQLRALARRQVQELDILKKPSPVACYKRRLSQTLDQ
jgi:transposase-like protein